ncbi:3-deoxy-manno-octulosonate cytidylyltransferase [Geothermobacter hydrogeniphilus]|uniref:3-deoxy-manno-octulosonate cytidylyltransferase n=1 Tax=Geothermobacter hydrogeniphilus TaxID=1969733 RepID=A0A1X0Y3A4_9BACT|nr:3-deoxy-manno-octulosonate cytidylyltransferase [Geothermobacter hydrogeniphilus]ORJ59554.1 3-deoxy-D-manno-octulosonate cytidylyltransferase [Geothermobacter hydrogeniphilus]
MDVTIVIPARYASSRFPGKPLATLQGRPMIQWVYERSCSARLASRVLVATDDERIADAVRAFGGEAVLTRADHPTGTDRLAEVASGLESELIVNVQGDEPLIEAAVIDRAIAPLIEMPDLQMGTLCAPLKGPDEFLDPNVVKVVCDQRQMALYFSRAPIPWPRDHARQLEENWDRCPAFRHIGLYVYRREFLLRYPTLSQTPLEMLESLEQLRALEHGVGIKVVPTEHAAIGVDTPEDLARVERILAGR